MFKDYLGTYAMIHNSTVLAKMTRIVGVLEAFSDQGTEGIHWAIIDNDKIGYDSLVMVNDGDYLFIEDGYGKIEWEGTVNLRTDTNLEPFPFNDRGDFWQRINDNTVHGIQENVEPNVWFEWFAMNRPAVLVKGQGVI